MESQEDLLKRDYAVRADLCDGVNFRSSLKNGHRNHFDMPNCRDRKRIFRSLKLLKRKSIQETVFVRLIHLTSSIALLSVFVGNTS